MRKRGRPPNSNIKVGLSISKAVLRAARKEAQRQVRSLSGFFEMAAMREIERCGGDGEITPKMWIGKFNEKGKLKLREANDEERAAEELKLEPKKNTRGENQ